VERVDPRQSLVTFLADSLEGWDPPAQLLDLGDERWLPDLEGPENAVLYVALSEIEAPWERRIEAAKGLGYGIHVACVPQALTVENLEVLHRVDAKPLLIDEIGRDLLQVVEYDSVADLVAQYELALDPSDLRRLAQPLLDRARTCDDRFLKGLLFEQVLCLIFSQTSYFRVIEHRYIGETEEIDVVLGNRATGELRGVLGGPLVLVSGKNQAKAVGAPEVRALRGNMSNRRGRCNFGVLASANTLASTTKTEQIRATSDPSLAVALLDGEAIDQLLLEPDLDHSLERILLAAVMD
jgi:hypothetical protein